MLIDIGVNFTRYDKPDISFFRKRSINLTWNRHAHIAMLASLIPSGGLNHDAAWRQGEESLSV
ncbi:hypothetical protein, partial [Pseudomonas sp. 5Ae-yellow]|uniref:hypothetical protein n=1 Tax=Pseudomonas sp. 5Ae-yellow TaxID=2759848 RepID=UPI002174E555